MIFCINKFFEDGALAYNLLYCTCNERKGREMPWNGGNDAGIQIRHTVTDRG